MRAGIIFPRVRTTERIINLEICKLARDVIGGCGYSEKRKPYMYKCRSALPYIPALYIGYIYSTPS